MKYTAKELKQITGKPTRAEGETFLYNELGQRAWRFGARSYNVAGYDRCRDLVHFTATWAAEGGGVGHSRLGLSLRSAVEGNGDLAQAIVLH